MLFANLHLLGFSDYKKTTSNTVDQIRVAAAALGPFRLRASVDQDLVLMRRSALDQMI